ncbi:unnamed protein product [Cuscuta campestris]|uniref:Uncharacterized protein n=1 Tax=Cuscuta campestris TaxID=132261 RepID=A0A484KUX0_9ASTE|nr:unnamed protein product [Cuscuta campestris]
MNVHQSALDEVKEAAEAEKKEMRDEVDRLAKELLDKRNRSSNLERENPDLQGRTIRLEEEKTSLSFEVESTSDLVAKLEAEKGDLVCRLEEAVETFKASPEFGATAMEQMDKLVPKWVATRLGEDWMVEQSKVSYRRGLFKTQQVFRRKLALLPKGTSLPDFSLPPPCDDIEEFDPTPYIEEEDFGEEENEEIGLGDQGN